MNRARQTRVVAAGWVAWIATLGTGWAASAVEPVRLEAIPQPRQVEMKATGFLPGRATTIRVSDTVADRFSATLLRDALRATHGIDCNVRTEALGVGAMHVLRLCAREGGAPAVPTPPDLEQKEGYALQVGADGVAVAARTEAGLFYGAQTLIQLAEQACRDGTPVPGVAITDWPAFGLRGRYFDGSQYLGTVVTTRAGLEREIRTLARYKLNYLNIEMYNLAPFASFSACADANTLSLRDWQELIELAHRHHVMLVPSLQSFAQIYQVLWNCEAGKPYREETAPGLICPSRPENIAFLQGLYRDLMALFKYAPVLGVGCSEVGMQWQDRYCPRCRKRLDAGETLHDIYYKHVKNCTAAVEAAAKQVGRPVRPMMWADEFYCGYGGKRWVGIENIPKNVVMGHWQYWSRYQNIPGYAANDYDGIRGLLERGFDVLFLSASFEFNTYLHDLSPDDPKDGKWDLLYDAGICNIADQARWADVHNRAGLPGKVLGGGCATFSQHDIRGWDSTWYAYVLQAEYAWGDPSRPLAKEKERFTDAFAAVFYGARDRKTAAAIAAAYRELDAAKSHLERNNYLIRDFIGEYDIHDASYVDNDLAASLKLIDELRAKPKGPGKTIADVRARAEAAAKAGRTWRSRLAPVTANVRNTYSFGYLVSAAHKIENHAMRTLYMLDQQEAFAAIASAKDTAEKAQARRKLDELASRLDALRRDTQIIADEVDQLAFGAVDQLNWGGTGTEGRTTSLSSDTTGYHKVLAGLEAFAAKVAVARQGR